MWFGNLGGWKKNSHVILVLKIVPVFKNTLFPQQLIHRKAIGIFDGSVTSNPSLPQEAQFDLKALCMQSKLWRIAICTNVSWYNLFWSLMMKICLPLGSVQGNLMSLNMIIAACSFIISSHLVTSAHNNIFQNFVQYTVCYFTHVYLFVPELTK